MKLHSAEGGSPGTVDDYEGGVIVGRPAREFRFHCSLKGDQGTIISKDRYSVADTRSLNSEEGVWYLV